MKYLIDIDGVLCHNGSNENYLNATPINYNIDSVNELYLQGNQIQIFTSRLTSDSEVTEDWLRRHGVKYHSITYNKPTADFYIDDKAVKFIPYLRPQSEETNLVVCVSGGLDSTIAYEIAKKRYSNIIALFFDVGQPYVDKERNTLGLLGIPFIEISIPVYKNMDLDNYILPNRNSIFANIASLYGNRIWIVGLKYEDHYLMHDKNTPFYNYISLSLSQSTGRNIIVETPFGDWSKTDIFMYCLKNNLMNLLDITTSCYHPTLKRCGECSLCVKRYVAGMTVGVKETFSSNPKESYEAKRLVAEYENALKKKDFIHYTEERIIESLKILR